MPNANEKVVCGRCARRVWGGTSHSCEGGVETFLSLPWTSESVQIFTYHALADSHIDDELCRLAKTVGGARLAPGGRQWRHRRRDLTFTGFKMEGAVKDFLAQADRLVAARRLTQPIGRADIPAAATCEHPNAHECCDPGCGHWSCPGCGLDFDERCVLSVETTLAEFKRRLAALATGAGRTA